MDNKNILTKTKSAKSYNKQTPSDSDYSNIITSTGAYKNESGEMLFVYGNIKQDLFNGEDVYKDLKLACKTTKYSTAPRSDGMNSTSYTFGYRPRNPVRLGLQMCGVSGHHGAVQNKIFCGGSRYMADFLKLYNPAQYEIQKQLVESKISSDWRFPCGVFTSGIVNKNNPLQYHTDGGNVKNSWSCMVVFKHKIKGGYLVLPEYDTAIDIEDGGIIAFSGASVLHGVSPIRKIGKSAYRYSIVWYALEQLCHCLPPKEEIKWYTKKRDEYERRQLKRSIKK